MTSIVLSEPPVVCAGVIVADHLCTPISHVPTAGELVKADELILNIGGCASNAAVEFIPSDATQSPRRTPAPIGPWQARG